MSTFDLYMHTHTSTNKHMLSHTYICKKRMIRKKQREIRKEIWEGGGEKEAEGERVCMYMHWSW